MGTDQIICDGTRTPPPGHHQEKAGPDNGPDRRGTNTTGRRLRTAPRTAGAQDSRHPAVIGAGSGHHPNGTRGPTQHPVAPTSHPGHAKAASWTSSRAA
ncbi:hypothetical protein ACFC1R_34375 [Kitasatospora sp. NPDC056138]|uniref:hypothetical protein n=1 Tax=Kitasatospora sp. NPDC056138 TaxID=3345724 RepID=UPI0035E2FC1E